MKRIILPVLCLIFFSQSLLADKSPYKIMNLTGNFNDWNQADNNYIMEYKNKSIYSIIKFFKSSHIAFKFNVDKSWNVNFGKGKKIGVVEKGGDDIKYFIKEPGYYSFILDIKKGEYKISSVPPLKPIPVVRYKKYLHLNETVVFDASASRPRKNKKIKIYKWKQSKKNPKKICNCSLKNKPVLKFKVKKPGRYVFYLTLDDGASSPVEKIEFDVVNQYTLKGDPPFNNLAMEYLGEKRYQSIVKIEQTKKYQFTVVMNNKTEVQDRIKVKLRKGEYYVLSYHEGSEEFNYEKESFAFFQFNMKDYPKYRNKKIKEIAVAGDFNNWDKTTHVLKEEKKGVYSLLVPLEEGLYYYKFVINGKDWIYDKKSDPNLSVSDNYGGKNAGFYVGTQADLFGTPKKNKINMDAFEHLPDESKYCNVVKDDLLEVKVRLLKDDADKVKMVYFDRKKKTVELKNRVTQFGFDYFSDVISLQRKKREVQYYFIVYTGKTVYYIGDGYTGKKKPKKREYFSKVMKIEFPTPDWAKGITWYQIMVDRFCNGNRKNDPDCTVDWKWDWYMKYPCEKWDHNRFNHKKHGFYGWDGVWHRLFGGDLQGLMSKLDYLKKLGVKAIYLNPMFESPSHHKYDAADYRHIDDNFGFKGDNQNLKETEDPRTWKWTKTDKLFLKFIKKAHNMGFKVVIDGVFNHSGDQFWAFNNLKKNQRKSIYKDWFVVKNWDPFQYEGWAGFSGLPIFKEDEGGLVKGVADHIFHITRRWMDPNNDGDPSDGIDGWRLDVPNEVGSAFWRKWRKLVKSINKDAYITGEIWGNAKSWLKGDQFDAVMNYEFSKRVYKFFIHTDQSYRLSPSQFDKSLKELLSEYPLQVNLVMQNLLDSHDTDRIISGIKNPNRDFDSRNRLQDGDKYNESKPGTRDIMTYKLIQLFQFTFVGAPMIYYGTEVGMYSSDDPNNRMPMWWQELMPYENRDYQINMQLLNHTKRLMAIHNKYRALQIGSFSTLLIDDNKNLYGFKRSLSNEIIYVILNNGVMSQNIELKLPKNKVKNLLNGKEIKAKKGKFKIKLKPKYGVILK